MSLGTLPPLMLLANWHWSIFNVSDQGFDGGGILISGDASSVMGGKTPTISEFANNINAAPPS